MFSDPSLTMITKQNDGIGITCAEAWGNAFHVYFESDEETFVHQTRYEWLETKKLQPSSMLL